MPSMTMQQFSWRHFNQWHLGVLPIVLLLAAGSLYLIGMYRVPVWSRGRALYFFAGLVTTFLSTQWFIGYYDMEYFSDHMIEHLLLIMVAAPFFALSAPLDLAYLAGPAQLRQFLDGRFMTGVTRPLVAFALYFAFIPITHLTDLFNLMMQHEWLHHLEQVGFLIIGYLFFRAAFGRERGETIHPGLRLVYIMAAVPVDTFTGLALAMTTHNPFPGYVHTAPRGSTPTSILANIHLGGAIMWIGGDALMLLACIPISLTWVRWETVKTRELDVRLDALGL